MPRLRRGGSSKLKNLRINFIFGLNHLHFTYEITAIFDSDFGGLNGPGAEAHVEPAVVCTVK